MNLSEQDRVDMWVQRLGGCPSLEDFLAFGTNLKATKSGSERYVAVESIKDPILKTNFLEFSERSTKSHKCYGRRICIDLDESLVTFELQ